VTSDLTARHAPVVASTPFQPIPFVPRRWLGNGHLQTIVGNFLPRRVRPEMELPAPATELVEVSAPIGDSIGSRVLCHCHWQPEPVRAGRLTVLLLHGLEGSSSSQYIVGNARKLWHAGANVLRMNMRNCGGTEALTSTLYHSGLSSDVAAVLRFFIAREALERTALVGYSMGGNLVLKLAGEVGRAPDAAAFQPIATTLCGVVGVSPALDLGPSADELHKPMNRMYERRFLKALIRRFRRKVAMFPRVYDPARADGLVSLRDFDERITAFYSGFTGASDYYFRASAARVLDTIAAPTLILHAADDPFVRITPESRAAIAANPRITLIEPAHGGHCAFLATPHGDDDGYWAESTLLQFLFSTC
jgi:predicted alpha/beta-fold hydrolase